MDFTTVLTAGGNGISLQTYFDKGNITFNRIEIGSGINTNPKESTELANKQIVGQFLGIERNEENESAIIKFAFDNKEVTEKFECLEYGIWATYTTDSGKKIDCLYAYGYSNSGKGEEISAFTGSKSYFKDKLNVALKIGSPDSANVYLGEYEDFADKESLEEHISNKNNPHKVEAKDIGLENVDNVSTNDATPTFKEAEKLENIVSGENVSTLWGKVKKAISFLKTHIGDNDNPHKLTASKINAAEASHKHSTTDINSGIMSAARGGTGYSSIPAMFTAFAATNATMVDFKWITSGTEIFGFAKFANGFIIQFESDVLEVDSKNTSSAEYIWAVPFISTPLAIADIYTPYPDLRMVGIDKLAKSKVSVTMVNNGSTTQSPRFTVIALGKWK